MNPPATRQTSEPTGFNASQVCQSLLETTLRNGAQQMLQWAIEAEVTNYLHQHRDQRDERGHRLVVGNRHLPAHVGSLLEGGDVEDGADCGLSEEDDAHEQIQEFVPVDAIGLGAFAASVDFDAGGVEGAVVDALFDEESMEPESVAAGFVAGVDGSVSRETEFLFDEFDFLQECLFVSGVNTASADLFAIAEAEEPFGLAQFECEKEDCVCLGCVCCFGVLFHT